jgi:hypothetical protein
MGKFITVLILIQIKNIFFCCVCFLISKTIIKKKVVSKDTGRSEWQLSFPVFVLRAVFWICTIPPDKVLIDEIQMP